MDPETDCNDICVNLQSDEAHCGSCNTACGQTQNCNAGQCECDDQGLDLCGGGCVNLDWDNDHCGSCNNACGNDECKQGECIQENPYGKVIFMTSTLHAGDFTFAEANQICQNRADGVNLPGDFKVWLSTNGTSASDRLTHSNEPYVRIDDVEVAIDWDDLIDGQIDARIINELDQPEGSWPIWTGTLSNGDGTNKHCTGWTGAGQGTLGNSWNMDSQWTDWSFSADCTSLRRLYCLEQ